MGAVGTTNTQNTEGTNMTEQTTVKNISNYIPVKPKFYKWNDGYRDRWMLVDAKEDEISDKWYSGIEIVKESMVFTTNASGKGHSSSGYQITYKGHPVIEKWFGTLKEAKEYIMSKKKA